MAIATREFRQDINGLRAWAVVPVMLFHFRVAGFSGGFVGVDIFFVISGFLMTGMIVRGLEKPGRSGHGFSLVDFYLSRARRIIPALLVLTLAVMTLGWFFLSSQEYEAQGRHALGALSFLSNIQFWQEAGYFDSASHEKLLLHTWSLSDEWQFYLILPLLLLAAWTLRPGRKTLVVAVSACLAASLLISVIASPIRPAAAFFLLPSRAWEMLAGGLVFLLAPSATPTKMQAKLLEGVGLALIIASVAVFNAHNPWPGWRALLPVVGTMLVIAAARADSPWTRNPVVQWLGTCSYSLYLWHWPVAVALSYVHQLYNPIAVAVGLAVSLLLGWLSYRLVETPTRTSLARVPPRAASAAIVGSILVLSLPALLVALRQGLPQRFDMQTNAIFSEALNKNPRIGECLVSNNVPVPECTYGGQQLGVIVLGDSHAGAVIRAVEKALPTSRQHVLDWTLAACPTIFGIKEEDNPHFRCAEFLSFALEKHKKLPLDVPMIIINRSSSYIVGNNEPELKDDPSVPYYHLNAARSTRSAGFKQEMRQGIIETACEFARLRPVYMVQPIPEMGLDVPKTMGRGRILGKPAHVSISMNEYQQRHAFVLDTERMAAARCGVKLLDPVPYLCRDGRCQGDKDGLPLYYDDDHLNLRGAELLVPMFRRVFDNTANIVRNLPEDSPSTVSDASAG